MPHIHKILILTCILGISTCKHNLIYHKPHTFHNIYMYKIISSHWQVFFSFIHTHLSFTIYILLFQNQPKTTKLHNNMPTYQVEMSYT